MTDYPRILQVLSGAGVEYILVGGVAAVAHGAARLTLDVDIVYRRTGANLERIVHALASYQPYPRGAPAGLPFHWDSRTLENGLNFTLTTRLGDLDLLGEITAGGPYDELLPHSSPQQAFGVTCQCLNLDYLILTKRAVGRPKDLEAIAELEALRGEQTSAGEAQTVGQKRRIHSSSYLKSPTGNHGPE